MHDNTPTQSAPVGSAIIIRIQVIATAADQAATAMTDYDMARTMRDRAQRAWLIASQLARREAYWAAREAAEVDMMAPAPACRQAGEVVHALGVRLPSARTAGGLFHGGSTYEVRHPRHRKNKASALWTVRVTKYAQVYYP